MRPLSARESSLVGWLAVATALAHGGWLAWLSDDAFISFRYARNWVHGLGLVFNAGERVEGYTNPLWTFWVAAGLKLGAPAEVWANGWSLLAYAASIAMLAQMTRERAAKATTPGASMAAAVPIAAVLGALNVEWATFATSGLETSLLAMFVTALVWLLGGDAIDRRRVVVAAIVAALTAMTRHDAVLFVAIAGGSIALRRRWSLAAIFGAIVAVAWVPFTLWRVRYYGDYFPNTYYAKSASLAWWSQGLTYEGLFFERNWLLVIAGVLAIVLALSPGAKARRSIVSPRVALAGAFVVVHLAYVARVGGDFMFGRFLVPIVPAFAVIAEAAVVELVTRGLAWATAAAAGCIAIELVTPSPVSAVPRPDGIVDERAYYADSGPESDRDAAVVLPFVDGVPLRVAIYGSEARFVYRLPVDPVIESVAGLTDAKVAHQPLAKRGIIGHEKHASLEYLLRERKVDMVFHQGIEAMGIDEEIPRVIVAMGPFNARLLHWDPAIARALEARGAKVPDVPKLLDGLLSKLDQMPDDAVAREYRRATTFYFDFVNDEPRRARFLERLRAAKGAPATPR